MLSRKLLMAQKVFSLCLLSLFFAFPALAQGEMLGDVEAALGEHTAANQDLQSVEAGEIPDSIAESIEAKGQAVTTEQARVEARQAVQTTHEKLEQARVSALAQASDKTEAELQAMRQEGMGWGEIAHSAGVHPSALGVGKGAQAQNKKQQAKQVKKKKASEKSKKAKSSKGSKGGGSKGGGSGGGGKGGGGGRGGGKGGKK